MQRVPIDKNKRRAAPAAIPAKVVATVELALERMVQPDPQSTATLIQTTASPMVA